MVQRHLRYEGEKDTRGPADFSGNATKQMDDTGDGDDDDGDEDDNDSGVRGHSKRRPDGRLKPPPQMGMSSGPELGYSRIAMPTQPPMSMPGLQPPPSSSLPISSDREIMHATNPSLKRQRVEHPPHSRSSSDDPGSGPPYFPSSSNYRQQPYHQAQTGPNVNQYGTYFGSQTSPPPSFIPLQPEYSGRGTAPPTRTGSSAGGGGAGSGNPTGGGGHYGPRQQYDPTLYPPTGIIRHPHQQQHPGGPGSSDMFPVYQLEADGQRQAAAAAAAQNQFGLEWPVHNSTSSAPPAASSAGPPSSVSNASSGAPSSAGGEWLDFLSGNNPNASTAGSGGGAHASHTTSVGGMSSEAARNSLSWERGHELPEIFPGGSGSGGGCPGGGGGGGGSGGSDGRPSTGRSGTGASPMSGNKRARVVEQAHDDDAKQGG
jgi:MADS-box transcription factor